ncbi:hypothetical protein V8E52_002677, partial [Russula decolorans]
MSGHLTLLFVLLATCRIGMSRSERGGATSAHRAIAIAIGNNTSQARTHATHRLSIFFLPSPSLPSNHPGREITIVYPININV